MAASREGTHVKTFEAGEVLFRQGELGAGEAYFIQSGRVLVWKTADGAERLLGTRHVGDLVGEIALFGRGAHSATAIAAEPVTALAIPAARLEHIVRANPDLALALIRQLARMASGEPGPSEPV